MRAQLATELSISLVLRRPGGEGVAMLEESLREIPDHRAGLGLFLHGHPLIHTLSGLEEVPPQIMPEREAWPDGGTAEGRFILRQLAFLYAVGFGPMENVMDLIERTGADLSLYADDVRVGLPAHAGSAAMALADHGDLTSEYFATAFQLAEERGSVTALSSAHGMRAWCLLGDGDLGAAWVDAESAVRLTEATGLQTMFNSWVSAALRTLVAKGEPVAAEELLARVWQGREPGPGIPGALLLAARGELRLERGSHAEARHDFLAAASECVGCRSPTRR